MVEYGHMPALTDHLAQLLHDRYCTIHRPHRGFRNQVPHGGCMFADDHAWIREAGLLIGQMLPRMGELTEVIRADERAKVAHCIRAELVCCDLYERLNAARPEHFNMTEQGWASLDGEAVANLIGADYHAICHWGGYAASIALNECPSGRRRCDPIYFCPTVNRCESPCHGGFDVCCTRPDLHQTIGEPDARPATTP